MGARHANRHAASGSRPPGMQSDATRGRSALAGRSRHLRGNLSCRCLRPARMTNSTLIGAPILFRRLRTCSTVALPSPPAEEGLLPQRHPLEEFLAQRGPPPSWRRSLAACRGFRLLDVDGALALDESGTQLVGAHRRRACRRNVHGQVPAQRGKLRHLPLLSSDTRGPPTLPSRRRPWSRCRRPSARCPQNLRPALHAHMFSPMVAISSIDVGLDRHCLAGIGRGGELQLLQVAAGLQGQPCARCAPCPGSGRCGRKSEMASPSSPRRWRRVLPDGDAEIEALGRHPGPTMPATLAQPVDRLLHVAWLSVRAVCSPSCRRRSSRAAP